MKEREITALEEGLGYHFRRRAVIEQAVTHSSQAREQEAQQAGESKYKVSDNEQLEFLGDAVLQLVTSEELFQRFPHFREGELSKLRAHLVSERHLIRVAQQLELGHYLRLGPRRRKKRRAGQDGVAGGRARGNSGGDLSGWRAGGCAKLCSAQRDCAGTGAHGARRRHAAGYGF